MTVPALLQLLYAEIEARRPAIERVNRLGGRFIVLAQVRCDFYSDRAPFPPSCILCKVQLRGVLNIASKVALKPLRLTCMV